MAGKAGETRAIVESITALLIGLKHPLQGAQRRPTLHRLAREIVGQPVMAIGVSS